MSSSSPPSSSVVADNGICFELKTDDLAFAPNLMPRRATLMRVEAFAGHSSQEGMSDCHQWPRPSITIQRIKLS